MYEVEQGEKEEHEKDVTELYLLLKNPDRGNNFFGRCENYRIRTGHW